MTRLEAETMILKSDIESVQESMQRAAEFLERRTAEMVEAIKHGYDLSCHAGNVTSAAADLAKLGERLAGLNRCLYFATKCAG
jgi:hypothetical protein